MDLLCHREVTRLFSKLGGVDGIGLEPMDRQLGLEPPIAQRPHGRDRDILALVAVQRPDHHELDRIGGEQLTRPRIARNGDADGILQDARACTVEGVSDPR